MNGTQRHLRPATYATGLLVLIWMGWAALRLVAQPATQPTTQPLDLGPDLVMMKELVNLYDPVPFDHKAHAGMAEMWQGCVTCHHRPPAPTTQAVLVPTAPKSQEDAAAIPACKSCHPVAGPDNDIRVPGLKGAYHRQCLNCHREWTHANACGACHKPRHGQLASATQPSRDDIVGRMHPPIPEPESKLYRARFTPADGSNILFRHKEHTTEFGLKCVHCHHRDNCSHCHDPKGDKTAQKPLKPGLTWEDSHGPCMSCHKQDRCKHCHYKDDQQPPRLFDHLTFTGQGLDKDHITLQCTQCHAGLKTQALPTCGDSRCHEAKTYAYPADRPGPVLTTQPALRTTLSKEQTPAGSSPAGRSNATRQTTVFGGE